MKRLKASSLRAGDIILTTTDALVSKGIRKKTRSDISHAMIYVQGHAVIDATAEGVQGRNTQRLFYPDTCAIHALRLRRDLSAAEALSICNYARNAIGAEYSTKEAVKTVLGGSKTSSRRQFCSRLAARAYAQAGIQLVTDEHYCTPDDLKQSAELVLIEDMEESASQEEFELWSKRMDFPQMMRASINALLKAARKCDRGIQSQEDIGRYLITHPEADRYMCKALRKSGHLTLWAIERDKNPWQYDLTIMKTVPDPEGMDEYCRSTLADEELGTSRYYANRGAYMSLTRQYGLRYFKLNLELYEILAALHRRRVEVAKAWLEYRSLRAPVSDTILRPHTAPWFAALQIWNPQQAAMTRFVIEKAGSTDVCSVCGDTEAKDYRLLKAIRPSAGTDTLRLCNGCVNIRQDMGDFYEPLPPDTPDGRVG